MTETDSPDRDAIGYFPETNYPVLVRPNDLVTHNTAILGILGVGKTFLSLELVERSIGEGIKIICLDLTDQYADALGHFTDKSSDKNVDDQLKAIGEAGKTVMSRNVEEGGSINQFTDDIKLEIKSFLNSGDERMMRVFDPSKFEVWQQTGGMFGTEAAMATLSPVEIARLVTESALEVVQSLGMTDTARCCIVFEEAHSLIPEWNSAVNKRDQTATNGTASAILQGRKFGLGCLLITQRTASVTKSILNQCNTIFALRVFDATGMEFLSNYIGSDYAEVLSTLGERRAVVYGRGTSCNEPIMVQLNNREDFITVFRSNDRITPRPEMAAEPDADA